MQPLPSLRRPYHENTPPVIPVSVCPNLEASDATAERLLWKMRCVILMTVSPSLSIGLFLSSSPPLPAFLSVFLHPHLSAPAPSLCPHWLPDEGKLMPEFIERLGLLPASLGSSARLHGGGASCLKGTAFFFFFCNLLSHLFLPVAVNTPSLSPLTLPI